MKVNVLIEKVGLMDDRLKIVEGNLKTVMDALEKRAEEEVSHLSW